VLFPNPDTGTSVTLQTQLNAPGNVRVRIYTVAYRKILDKTFDDVPAGPQNLVIPLNSSGMIANGLYYVVVTANGNRWVLKLLLLR